MELYENLSVILFVAHMHKLRLSGNEEPSMTSSKIVRFYVSMFTGVTVLSFAVYYLVGLALS